MKKLFSILLVIFALLSAVSTAGAYEVESFDDLHSDVALLMSLDYGTVIYEKNADKRTPPSSLAKIVASLVALEYYGQESDEVITANYNAILEVPYGTIASGLKGGENLTLTQLLYYIMVQSANDAVYVLAYQVGSENMRPAMTETQSFTAMMNELAERLGCENTYFSDCAGLDDEGSYTTARDLAKIAKYAYQNSRLMRICSTHTYTVEATNANSSRLLANNNSLIIASSEYYYRYANGMKTGASNKGRCLIATSEKDGKNYLAIVMESEYTEDEETGDSTNYSFIDAKTLLDWANRNLVYRTLVDKNTVTGIEIPVKNGSGVDYVRLVPGEEIRALVPASFKMSDVSFKVDKSALPESLNATVHKGDEVCTAQVICGEESLGEVKLVCANDVSLNIFLAIGSAISTVFGITAVRIIVFIAIALLVLWLVFSRSSKKKKKRIRVVDRDGENTGNPSGK